MTPIAEHDLHAYVDGQLAPDRREEVERHLADNPDQARLVSAWQAQRAALRAAFAGPAEPLPEKLQLGRLMAERRRRVIRARFGDWRIAAGFVLALGAGGAAGWYLHAPATPSRSAAAMRVLEQEALTSHIVYAADRRHPIEVPAAEEAHLAQWLSNRLARPVAPPDLSSLGYHLIGGRLLATEHGGAAALLMYANDAGMRISLVLRPMAAGLAAPQTDIVDGQVRGCAWIEKGMGYAVVAALPDSELDRVAAEVRGAG